VKASTTALTPIVDAAPRIREVEDSDLETVARLVVAEGWGAPSPRDWQWLWAENPAAQRCGLPRGWVLVDGGSVVGYLGNVAQEYQLGDRRLTAAVACALVVSPAFRGSSLHLMMAHARQRNVDLLLNTTAAPHVSKIHKFLKFVPVPQPTYDRSQYWVLRTLPFARAALRKKGYSPAVIPWGGPVLALLVGMEGALRRRGPLRSRSSADVLTIAADAIGAEFDDLWERKVSEGRRLLAVRDARTLRWHFAERGQTHTPFLVCAHAGSRLVGYVAVVRQDATHLDLPRARVADIFVAGDDPSIIQLLLCQAAARARERGAAMLEVIGLPRTVRRAVDALRPLEIPDESPPFLFKAVDPRLQNQLADETVWYAGLFDGDGSL